MIRIIEATAEALGTIDTRLAAIEETQVDMLGHLADDAKATEEAAKSLQKLQELYLSIDARLEELTSMVGNYVEATKGLREEARRLESSVRARLG